MTNREFYTAIVNGEMNDEIVAKATEEIAKLDARNAKRSATPSKKSLENEPIKAKIVEFLASDLAAEAANGEDHGGASRDSTEDTWSAKYSCSLGDDTFTVTITREYMLVNGFEEDATLAAVETWADSQTALGGESA